ncbi:heme exporter protein CcmB [Roseateles asaccharophilus]|uniref:Heme exporter protein CcmB n=1 Tax=Roseateles asaccharophilus TaxID=582607 RepID=A0ABU2A5D4_9BURK|nr:heme exporter protein CcmB [Roseateles asaccharophilus]MDR7331707.1 heme exporter protein CcmB [Roseateles asaccharophilus]
MSAAVQAAAALALREWRGLLRQPAEWLTPLAFVAGVALVFPLGPDPARLRELAPGLLWIAALLASLLSLPRLFAPDLADGSLEQWWLSPRPLMPVPAVALSYSPHLPPLTW